MLYVGRKETGKNVQLLVDYFCGAKDSKRIPEQIKLVIAGGGDFSDLHREAARSRHDIIDLTRLTEAEKARLIRHSIALCQPSVNESFSIVLMEAWRLETPVVVHGKCAVTREHVEESGGGLYFEDQEEFTEVIRLMMEDSQIRLSMGQAGADYVVEKYSWKSVLERFDGVVNRVLDSPT